MTPWKDFEQYYPLTEEEQQANASAYEAHREVLIRLGWTEDIEGAHLGESTWLDPNGERRTVIPFFRIEYAIQLMEREEWPEPWAPHRIHKKPGGFGDWWEVSDDSGRIIAQGATHAEAICRAWLNIKEADE